MVGSAVKASPAVCPAMVGSAVVVGSVSLYPLLSTSVQSLLKAYRWAIILTV